MEEQFNRRISDTEIVKLVERVINLEAEVRNLCVDLEAHEQLDEQTHAKMMVEMNIVQSKIDTIMKELLAHTKAEEDKFTLIIENQENHKTALDKLVSDTFPAVEATKWVNTSAKIVKFIKDVIVPLIVGGAITFGVTNTNQPVEKEKAQTTEKSGEK